ncbi:MAG: PAS domain S-box protein [Spirochaetes bacterium]|jgi:PAS domain S-box-containing protein|nr:PAS domain S-box protein [Spirochaetota bacterium]
MSKRILLVEDEALIAMSEAQILEKHGYEVVIFHNGEKAIEAVDSDPEISLILMDIDLGNGMDGTEAAERILEGHDLPVAFLSSHTEPEVVEKTEGITSYGYIVKNSGDTVLLASIKMAFRLYEAHVELKRQKESLGTALVEQEQIAEQLHESEEKFRTMMNQSIDMFFLHDLDGNIVDVNQRGVDLTGYSREELLSMAIPDLDPDYVEREDGGNFWKNVGYDQPYRFEAQLRRKDDSVFPIEIVVSKVGLGGSTYILTSSRDISERKRAEQQLRAREENLRITLNSIGDAVISTDIEGRIVRMNPVAESLCGWRIDEAKGKALHEVFRIVHADTGKEAQNPVAKVLETGHVVGLANHTMLISRDGTKYQIADSAAPIRDDTENTTGVVLVFRDVTEEYRVAQALADSERDMARAQAMAQLGSWRFDRDSGVVIASDQARRIYGVCEGELTIEHVQSLVLPEYRPKLDAALAALVENGTPYDVEFQIRRPSDNRVRIIHSVAEYDAQHHWVVGTLQDITERKQAEAEIQRQLSEKETLLREVHHRIKNSIFQVESLLSLQASSTDNAHAKAALQDAISRVGSIRLLYEKLLVAKEHESVSARDYAESLIDSLVAVFPERKNVTLEKRIADFTLPSRTATLLGIIINELLTNVFKYAFENGDEGRVVAELSKTDDLVTLTIHDNGVGIDTRGAANKTSGFGLTIVRMLAEQLDGTYAAGYDNGTKSVLSFTCSPPA